MAVAHPVGWVSPQNLTQAANTSTISKAQLDMSDEAKRWVIVGITLNEVLVPALKQHVHHKMTKFYSDLVHSHNIDKQSTPYHIKFDPGKNSSTFNYKSLKKKPNIVKIMSHDELAKLYLEPRMVKFKQITDDKFEGSAVLNILGKASCFTNNEDKAANEVRSKVRNDWAHCQMKTWNDVKFLDSFQLMENLAQTLPNAAHVSKDDLVAKIKEWREDGLKLLGNNVDKKLLHKTVLAADKVIATITACQEYFSTKTDDIINNMSIMKIKLSELEQRQAKVEEEQLVLKTVQMDHAERINSLEQSSENITNPFYDIPYRNVFFTGRSAILCQFQDAIKHRSEEPIIATISGLGGVGKTSIAVEFCYRMKEYFPGGVYWMTADTQDGDNGIKSSLFGLARRMNQVDPNIDDMRLVDLVTSYLLKQERALLIIDNLDAEEFSPLVHKVVNGNWVKDSKINILITSRLRHDELQSKLYLPPYSITLESFDLEEGVEFLRRRTEMEFHEVDGREIALSLGCLPLALEQAAAYIKASKCSFPKYLQKLNREKLKILGKKKAKPPTEYVESSRLAVKTTWNINMACIQEECPAAYQVMMVLSFLSPKSIPMSIINTGIPKLEDNDLVNSLEDDVEDMIFILTKLSLFDSSSENDVTVHRMVQDVLKEHIKNEGTIKCTLTNALRMLRGALDKEDSPHSIMDLKQSKISHKSILHPWAKILENIGNFLDEVKHMNLLHDELFQNSEFVDILQNASLYYYLINQTDRSAFYRELYITTMSKIRYTESYENMENFTLPLSIPDKEILYNLIEPPGQHSVKEITTEQRKITAESLKEDGNKYFKEKNYKEAIRSYIKCLEIGEDHELIIKVQLNLCQAFYLMKEYKQLKKHALQILAIEPQNSKAYLWLAFQYKNTDVYDYGENQTRLLQHNTSTYVMEYKEFSEVTEVVGELAYLYGALAIYFSEDKSRTTSMLEKKGLMLWRTKVVPVSNSYELQSALNNASLERLARSMRQHGERHIVFLKQGEYQLDPEIFSSCFGTLVYGEMTGNSSTLPKIVLTQKHLEEEFSPLVFSNIFINISFDLKQYQIHLHIKDDQPCLFYNCQFECNIKFKSSVKSEAEHMEEMYQKLKKNPQLLSEMVPRKNIEHVEMDPKYKQTNENLYDMMASRYTEAGPGILVSRGSCAIIDCELAYSRGGGFLSDGSFGSNEKPPILVVSGTKIRNCQSSGIEARNGGSLLSINNTIYENKKGLLLWKDPGRVQIFNCSIRNNSNEGIHATETSYANMDEVVIAGNRIHHNTLGISTDKIKCLQIQNNEIFNNNSWGMFLRNTQTTIIEGNDIHRNNCGGIRCSFNRFPNTIVRYNRIHDHTGPDIIQTSFMDEIEQQLMPIKFSKEKNSIKIYLLDNLTYNNELSYGKISDLIVSVQNVCNYCRNFGATLMCGTCGQVRYCNKKCQTNDFKKKHKLFCKYFQNTYIHSIKLDHVNEHKMMPHPSLKYRAGTKSSKDLVGSKFLVKIQSGSRHGLSRPIDENKEELTIYDESRSICGLGCNQALYTLVREFGKLASDMVFTKRIYVYATRTVSVRKLRKIENIFLILGFTYMFACLIFAYFWLLFCFFIYFATSLLEIFGIFVGGQCELPCKIWRS